MLLRFTQMLLDFFELRENRLDILIELHLTELLIAASF